MPSEQSSNLKSDSFPILAYHGTDGDFVQFDVAKAAPNNVGLHFGTRAAALARLEYIRSVGDDPRASRSNGEFRMLTCELTIDNPFRIDDVFGHSYGFLFDALEAEVRGRAVSMKPPRAALLADIARLNEEWIGSDDDPALTGSESAYLAYGRRLNAEFIRLFRALGYGGLVYTNELEGAAADSYCIFSSDQVKIVGEEIVHLNHQSNKAA